MNRKKIANLEFIEKPGQPGGPCIVFFHGYGADASDLASLSSMIQTPKGTTWLFPEGVLDIQLGSHFTGRAWFPIDMVAIEKARLEGKHRDLSKETPPGLKKIKEQFFEVLSQLKIPIENVILGGFSQGTMLTTYLTLNAPAAPKGLIVMSGALLDENT
jgi:phospholipase/carboxylesterase